MLKAVPYAALPKGSAFVLSIMNISSSQQEIFRKFSNAWAKPEKQGDWKAMISTDMVEPIDASMRIAAGIRSV